MKDTTQICKEVGRPKDYASIDDYNNALDQAMKYNKLNKPSVLRCGQRPGWERVDENGNFKKITHLID